MEEDASRGDSGSVAGSTHTIPPPDNNAEVFIPSFSPSSAPSSPTPTGTLSRLGFKSPASPGGTAPGSPAAGSQVSAITVVALLDKLVNMLESVQDNQQRMEQRQADLEGAVRLVQGDVTRLSKTHLTTSNCVSKLLERSRKVSGHLKDVKERMDKQAVQVKKLEANHNHLLKRNHFKVLIFQEDNEIPSSVFVKDSLKTPAPSQYDAESTRPLPSIEGSIDGRAPEEGLQTISLSSDEDLLAQIEEDMLEGEAAMGVDGSRSFERRADRFKRNSLKKVDSLKKAFSRQSFEKKVNQITTKIVPPEKRDKIKKSFTPNHPRSPTAKSSSFKVPPMIFNIKKVREGELPSEEMSSSGIEAHVEIPPLECSEGDISMAEVHTPERVVGEIQEMLSPSTPDSMKVDLAINGEAPVIDCEINGERSAGLAVPEHDDDLGVDEEEEEEEQLKVPVVKEADVQTPTATIAVEQAS